MTKDALDKAARALLKMGPVPHKRPGKPTKKDLERKFKMTTNRKDRPVIRETG
ncbi:MAG: hypothetical protein OXI88_20325 [Gammaproteobacteria bacterium]|nr:hypothetical protein [Gammaproteobacteria bacterium]MDE0283490.1 hypothetical protein [Gammaproteobacteria bacterium]MDE0514119.1 hypothetical protein [Gammaproteobacteria bacterium]